MIQLSAEVACINGAISQIEWDLLCLGHFDQKTASSPAAQATSSNGSKARPKDSVSSGASAAGSSSGSATASGSDTASAAALGSSSAFYMLSARAKIYAPAGARPLPAGSASPKFRPLRF